MSAQIETIYVDAVELNGGELRCLIAVDVKTGDKIAEEIFPDYKSETFDWCGQIFATGFVFKELGKSKEIVLALSALHDCETFKTWLSLQLYKNKKGNRRKNISELEKIVKLEAVEDERLSKAKVRVDCRVRELNSIINEGNTLIYSYDDDIVRSVRAIIARYHNTFSQGIEVKYFTGYCVYNAVFKEFAGPYACVRVEGRKNDAFVNKSRVFPKSITFDRQLISGLLVHDRVICRTDKLKKTWAYGTITKITREILEIELEEDGRVIEVDREDIGAIVIFSSKGIKDRLSEVMKRLRGKQ